MFVFRGYEAHSRSLLKAATWRTLGSIDTFVLGLIFTQSASAAGAIAGTEVFTKITLYYFHERAWSAIRWGHQNAPHAEQAANPPLGDYVVDAGT